MKRLLAALGLTSTVALVLAACGGETATSTPRPAPTPTALPPTATTAPPAPQTTRPPAATATPAPAPTSTPVPAPTAPPAGAPKRGGVLKQGTFGGGVASFVTQGSVSNPTFGAPNLWASRLLYQTLTKYDPYNNNVLSGLLAEKWEFSPGADQLTIQLRQGALWSDGKPVTAQDVKFTLDAYAQPPQGFVAGRVAALLGRNTASVTAVDARTLRVALKDADVAHVAILADPDAIIIPAHRTLEQSAKDPVGSGPYRLKDFQADVKFTFVGSANYWAKDSRGGALPYLDGVENIEIPDPSRAYAAILAGQIDLLNTIWLSALQGKESDVQRRIPGATLERYHGGNIGWGFRNAPPFDSLQVRKAMSLLTDRLAIVELVYLGNGVIDSAGVKPASSGSPWALPMKEILSAPGWRYVNKTTGALETDMVKLQQGLSGVYQKDPKDIEAGKTILRQAGLDPDKGQFPKLTLTTAQIYQQQAEAISGTLHNILGITASVDVLQFPAFNDRSLKGQFQAIVGALHPSAADEPSLTLRYFTSGAGLWTPGFETPDLDTLFAQQRKEVDPAKRRNLVWDFQRKVLEGASGVIPGANALSPTGLFREWVKNPPIPIGGSSNTFDLERAWLDR